jgi:hypothetical protein
MKSHLSALFLFACILNGYAQVDLEEVQLSKQEYIRLNHLDDIESIIHTFAESRTFIEFLLENEHHLSHQESTGVRRKDVAVGEDIDMFVKHFTEHQNFTMFLVPINIYSHAIYDTLLFSVLEVSDEWIKDKFWEKNVNSDSDKAHLLSIENHRILSNHMAEQAFENVNEVIAEMKVNLQEGYISTSSISYHISTLTEEEKKEFRKSWTLLKKALTHNVDLNVEMNIYVFGYDDMNVSYFAGGEESTFKITPSNIFARHRFVEK